ncbi:glycosyltransferase 87 family protein [Corynebacterium sp.]|uniref:glycosyltransferase 87 family protein n=1 Tax=Corynebacterium sp. TaxID=1720 RepID=UPI0026DDA439|nr:glycosyltransferase 87 family protein [Corynebacterium sp.]MDO5075948.1 glycosyltransferase 87 family protein [Corynebacterium sp.]
MVQRLLSPRFSWLLLLAAVVAVSVNGSGWRYLVDVEVYRQGARAFWSSPGGLYEHGFPTAVAELPFTYPPFGALVLFPLAVLPQRTAEVAMTATSVACLWISLRLVLPRRLPRHLILAATAIALLAEPVTSTISFGQINLLLMSLVLADFAGPRRLPRGVLTGIAAAIKLTPAVFVVYFLARRDYRAAAALTATFGGATALAWAMRPADSTQYFTAALWNTHRIGELGHATNVSLMAVLTRAGLETYWPWVVAALGCVVCVFAWRTRIDAAAFLAVALFGVLASPVSWSHHWVWLVPAVALTWRLGCRWWPCWAVAAMTVGQFHKWLPFGEWSQIESLLAAHYVFVGAGGMIALWRRGLVAQHFRHQEGQL